MKNRAKCRLCLSIIESKHTHDYVSCGCGEIAVDGGNDCCRAMAKDWNNFLRIDDADNEIIITVKEREIKEILKNCDVHKPTKKEMIEMLKEMIKRIEELPQMAMLTPINHYDYVSLLILLSGLFEAES